MNRVLKRIATEFNAQEEDGMKIFDSQNPYANIDTSDKEFLDSLDNHNNKEVKKETDFHGDFGSLDEKEKNLIINPTHYKIIPKEAYLKYPNGMQYMDIMKYVLAHLKPHEAAIMSQVFKYSLRIGKKDHKLQDAEKICWYANYMAKTVKEES